ncbi:MAG: hypothetical protein FJ215_12685 [Ignavibacteria bacterium]|nr:hypothetical protein [Ignavibacteria bacterium]
MMTDKKLMLGRVTLQATDALILTTLAAFSLLAVVFFWKVEQWWLLIMKNLAVGAIFLASVLWTKKISHRVARFLVRTAVVTLSYAYLFGAVDKLQLIIHGQWLDAYVLDFEQMVFGFQPTLWTQQFISPLLTEWMMFSYVIYVPLYPILCAIIYFKHGEVQMEEYFFALGLTNILCDIGFILAPVASPMYYVPEIYTVLLDGYIFTYLGELMRQYLHFSGGSIPSPHAAAATIMWVMAYRYHKPTFYVITPVILSLYLSTFYGRYHYLTDAVVGIVTAYVAIRLSPLMQVVWERLVDRRSVQPEASAT